MAINLQWKPITLLLVVIIKCSYHNNDSPTVSTILALCLLGMQRTSSQRPALFKPKTSKIMHAVSLLSIQYSRKYMGVKHAILADEKPQTIAFIVLAQLCSPMLIAFPSSTNVLRWAKESFSKETSFWNCTWWKTVRLTCADFQFFYYPCLFWFWLSSFAVKQVLAR